MRINDPALQDRMFHALGFTEEKARESFGFLMDAYKFGAPRTAVWPTAWTAWSC